MIPTAVKNLPSVEETAKLWDKHGFKADPMGVGIDGEACLVAILAADAGSHIDSPDEDMYDTVEREYGMTHKQVLDMENGFMELQHTRKTSQYKYGKAIAERVL